MIYTSTRSVLLFPRRGGGGGGGFLLHFRQESARGYVLFSRFIIARSEPYLFRGKKRNCDSTREKIQLIHSDISTKSIHVFNLIRTRERDGSVKDSRNSRIESNFCHITGFTLIKIQRFESHLTSTRRDISTFRLIEERATFESSFFHDEASDKASVTHG